MEHENAVEWRQRLSPGVLLGCEGNRQELIDGVGGGRGFDLEGLTGGVGRVPGMDGGLLGPGGG